jgi:peptide/nickel transport system permease protein
MKTGSRQRISFAPSLWPIFCRNGIAVAGAIILLALFALAIAALVRTPFDPSATNAGPIMAPPGSINWGGTDELGRDVFSRACIGLGTSLMVGLTAAGLATALAILVGAVAGYAGGATDALLMRLTEVFQVVPRFFLAILMVAFFGARVSNVILAIGLLSWPENARVVRAEFLSLKTRQYVAAATVAGASRLSIIFREILPNALGPIIVTATLQVGQAILLEAGLSYLGLGDPNQVSLGLMLYQAQEIMRDAWWATAIPGALLFLGVFAINVTGDGLNDAFNPRSRGR